MPKTEKFRGLYLVGRQVDHPTKILQDLSISTDNMEGITPFGMKVFVYCYTPSLGPYHSLRDLP